MELSEFIREEQVRYINPSGFEQPTYLYIEGGREGRANIRIFGEGGSGNDSVKLRGPFSGMDGYGYVTSIPQGSERHVNAPDYEFNFVVSRMLNGVMKDDPVTVNKLKNWNELFRSLGDRWIVVPELSRPFDPEGDNSLDRPPVAPGPGVGERPT
jgi:hypothetical protein